MRGPFIFYLSVRLSFEGGLGMEGKGGFMISSPFVSGDKCSGLLHPFVSNPVNSARLLLDGEHSNMKTFEGSFVVK